MKKLLLFIAFGTILLSLVKAQAPPSIPYQAVARDSFGTPLPNQAMQARMSIRNGSSSGTVVYSETDTFRTNKLGLFTVAVGSGTVVSGTFSSIDWAGGSKYLQVEIDPAGGTSYIDMGAQQLLSVPFALHAGSSSLANVPIKHIPYATADGITSDGNFTRDPNGGNTNIKVEKNGYYYSLNLGDSNVIDPGVGAVNLPSAALSYGDTGHNYVMNVGVGAVPQYGVNEFGFFNLSDSSGNFAAIDFLKDPDTDNPAMVLSTGKGQIFDNTGAHLGMHPNQFELVYEHVDSPHTRHGIKANENDLIICNGGNESRWKWPNTDGGAGQALVTDGSGNLSFTSPASSFTVPTKQIPYGGAGVITSDPGFVRDATTGNTLIKTVRGSNLYSLSLGDSGVFIGGGGVYNAPSAMLSYGDTTGAYSMVIGAGQIPAFGVYDVGFMNLSDSAGNTAAVDMVSNEDKGPMVYISACTAVTPNGGHLEVRSDDVELSYHTADGNSMHGIIADSLTLTLYSSATNYGWKWPNTDGGAGQALVTDGSGGLGWASTSGYVMQMSSAAFDPADTTSYYFGGRPCMPPTSNPFNGLIIIPRAGKIKAVNLVLYVDGTVASSENVEFYLSGSGITDAITTTATLSGGRSTVSNTGLAVDVTAGQELEIRVTTPVWATKPTSVSFTGNLYIE